MGYSQYFTSVHYLFFFYFLWPADFFNSNSLRKNISRISSESNSLDPDQVRRYVGPDLSSNCLQRLIADNTMSQSVGLG